MPTDPLKAGRAIPRREVRIACPPGYGGMVQRLWPDVRGIAYRKRKGWTLVDVLPPSAGGPAWYPDERVLELP